MAKRTLVVLCGSTRFYDEFQRLNYEFTMAGEIVLSVGFYHHAALEVHGEAAGCTPEQKLLLDDLHKDKIAHAHENGGYVFVINKGGYVGESTLSEIRYAEELGMDIEYLES